MVRHPLVSKIVKAYSDQILTDDKANVLSDHSHWKRIINKPNDYLKKDLENFLERLLLKEKTTNSHYF